MVGERKLLEREREKNLLPRNTKKASEEGRGMRQSLADCLDLHCKILDELNTSTLMGEAQRIIVRKIAQQVS